MNCSIRIYSLIDWAIKSNLQSYITDNPQREKLSGKVNRISCASLSNYAYEVQNLYHNLVQNIMDTQYDNGLVPDTVSRIYQIRMVHL